MTDVLKAKLKEVYDSLTENPYNILNIFNNYFGENNVDMQGIPSFEEFITKLCALEIRSYGEGFWFEDDDSWENIKYSTLTDLDKTKSKHLVSCLINDSSKLQHLFDGGYILIYFPHVTVTNEYDRSVEITKLFAKVPFESTGRGCGCFYLNRAEYPLDQFMSNYLHSHIQCIPMGNFTLFQRPCTGSGPINSTMSHLAVSYDEDLWGLFCLELHKYVQVESISGVPYRRLENIGVDTRYNVSTVLALNCNCYYPSIFNPQMLRDFTKYLIQNKKLKFNYRSGSYSIGMSPLECIILISNEFIDWYNIEYNKKTYSYSVETLIDRDILFKCIIEDNKIFKESNTNTSIDYQSHIGKKVCTFKGRDILLNIIGGINNDKEPNRYLIFKIEYILHILRNIFYIINYKYNGNNNAKQEEVPAVVEKVRYL